MSPPADPYKYFRVEAREILEQLEIGLLELEKGSAPGDVIARLLRLAHTLKGAARVVKQAKIAESAHAIEDLLAPLRDAPDSATREIIDEILRLLDGMRSGVTALGVASDEKEPSTPRDAAEESPLVFRTDLVDMDTLLNGLSNAHLRVSALRGSLALVNRLDDLAELLGNRLASPGERAGIDANGTAATRSLADEMRATVQSLQQTLTSNTEHIEREMRQLRDAAENLRLVPVNVLFPPLERTVRDTVRIVGNRAAFEGIGGNVRMDAHVLREVQGALIQMARNAIVHGIEPAAERKASGKESSGRVVFDVARRGNRVAFRCIDDGRGIDFESVRRIVEKKNPAAVESRTLSNADLLRLLLMGGLTTSGSVTEVSGRGVGLDIVRAAAARLGGEATIDTEAGRGTTVELLVPVSLSSMEALLFRVADVTGALPVDAVRRTISIPEGTIVRTDRGRTIVCDGSPLPLFSMAHVFGAEKESERRSQTRSAIVMETANSPIAIEVDRLLGIQTLVFRPMPALAAANPAVAGVAMDAEGIPQIVLDPVRLAGMAHGGEFSAPTVSGDPALPLLVVDDSLTTRMLEQSILESAGYLVDLAQSGEEAMEKARKKPYGLFLVDVEMPGMDGYTFVSRTRADPRLGRIPAILITSRGSVEDRRRGEEAGAAAYVVKSEFDQVRLLELIRQLQV
jgi:two-component system chemotaxis sensor kinase CheA